MARSLLFLPGNNPNMLINAPYLGADAVIFDLEDAVSPAEKDAARILVRNAMKYMDIPLVNCRQRNKCHIPLQLHLQTTIQRHSGNKI